MLGAADRYNWDLARQDYAGSNEMANSYTLYGWQGSGSLVVQVALEEIGVPYERVWVAREPEYLARFRELNPTGRVPALRLPDGTIMFESAAILIHLAAAHPAAHLAPPPGTSAHARFLQWLVYLSANVYESVLRIYYADRYSTRGPADAEAITARATVDYEDQLGLISETLAPYVLGAEYSVADAYLHMLAGWYPGDRAQLNARLPRLGVHSTLVAVRPAQIKVEADHAA
jgi:glutathione S-transferase